MKKRWMMIACLLACSGLILGTASTGSAEMDQMGLENPDQGQEINIESGSYYLRCYVDMTLMAGIDGGYTDNGARFVLTEFSPEARNTIDLAKQEDGFYSMKMGHSEAYLQSWDEENVIQAMDIADNGTGKWTITLSGSSEIAPVVTIKDANGQVLKPMGGDILEGTQVVLADEDSSDYTQKWYLIRKTEGENASGEPTALEATQADLPYGQPYAVTEDTYMLKSYADPTLVMGILHGYTDEGAPLVLAEYYNDEKNRIKVTEGEEGDGFYELLAEHTDSWLLSWDGAEAGGEMIQASYADNGTQKWNFVYCGNENGNDVVVLKNAAGTVMQAADASSESNILLAEEDLENPLQKWYLVPMDNIEQDAIDNAPVVKNADIGDYVGLDYDSYQFVSYTDPDYVLGICNGYEDSGASLVLTAKTKEDRNRFDFVDDVPDDGYGALLAGHTGFYLFSWEGVDAGAHLVQASEYSDTGAQKWSFIYQGEENGQSIVTIQNAHGTVLSAENETIADNDMAVLADRNDEDPLQKWFVVKY